MQWCVLRGEEEAALELRAARYCLAASLGDDAPDPRTVGLLSSGGASSQLAFPKKRTGLYAGDEVETRSLATRIKEGNSRCVQDGLADGLKHYGEDDMCLMRMERCSLGCQLWIDS